VDQSLSVPRRACGEWNERIRRRRQRVAECPGEGATARTVEIKNILQKSDGTYQVRWTETTYSNGIRRTKEEFTGLFQVKLIPPRDEADTFKNPIGVYITNFTWSREFSGAVLAMTTHPRAGKPRSTHSAWSNAMNP
jgi:hypothetical protein